MADQKYVTKNPPVSTKVIWCYFCDWHVKDSMMNRKRFGQHAVDNHFDELVYSKDSVPPSLEDY